MKKYYLLLILPVVLLIHSCSKEGGADSSSSGNSTGGSMARFTLVGSYLYTVNQQNLKTYNVSNPASPVLESTINVGPDIETIFPFKGSLYVGSSTTAYRYSISNPAQPVKSAQVAYFIRGKDPIVANDSIAYSTVRDFASGGTLNVINVKNVESLVLLNRFSLTNSPYGLGLADTALYVCEHSVGMKVYSIRDSLARNPSVRKVINNGETYYDVIPSGNLLYAWIEGGNSVFDITSRTNPVLLSKTKN